MGVVGLAIIFGGILLLFYTLAGGHFPWEPVTSTFEKPGPVQKK